MDNDVYNILKAMVKRAQVISKYEQYIADAAGCPECRALWAKVKGMDEQILTEMKAVFKLVHKDGL